MKKSIVFVLIALMLPFLAEAQLSKLMAGYHEQNCVTVTQLDKTLYGLYQKNNLPPEAEDMLKKLNELNMLNVDMTCNDQKTEDKIVEQFRGVLNNPDKYKLIKSRMNGNSKQLIYTRGKDAKVTDLVVWNQSPERLDIIELRGDIQLDKVALLSKALNIRGLNTLAALTEDEDSFGFYRRTPEYGDMNSEMQDMMAEMKRMAEEMRNHFGGSMGDMMDGMFSMFGDSFGKMGDWDMWPREKGEVFSNSVQVTEENGKTKIKIDSKNTDITYIIDGQQAPGDSVAMPERILNVNLIPSKEDLRKSYLFITSRDKLGEFVSFAGGVLTFRYDNQEYRYNLDKMQHPLLVIDGRLASGFDIAPEDILQIRPLSPIEKEAGYYPDAEVIINTK